MSRTSSFALVLLLGSTLSFEAASVESPEARAAYEEALASYRTRSESGLSEGLRLFEKAAALDPDFAEAQAGIADASCLLALYGYRAPSSVMPQAGEAAMRAIELDDSLAEAHASLGLVRYLYEWKFSDAETSFRRALALDPSYSSAHHWFAMMLMATGRTEESLQEIDRAMALEPTSALYDVKRGTILMAAGRLDEAEAHLAQVVVRHPRSPLGHRELGLLHLSRGDAKAAREELALASELSGGASRTEATYGLVLALLGEAREARAMLETLRAEEKKTFVSPIAEALLEVGLGEREAALDELERAFEMRDAALVYLRTTPGLAALREEPRFRALVDKIGLSGS